MAHHGSPDGAGHPGGPAADQPTQAQPARPGAADPASAYAPDSGYGVPRQPVPTHDQTGGGYDFGSPAAPAGGYDLGTQTGYGRPAAPAESGYGAPAESGYGAPAQPGPAASAPTGYGAPAQSGYGAPAQSGYEAPAPTGYEAPAPTGYVQPQQSAFNAPTQQTGYVAPAPGYANSPMSAPPVSPSPLGAPMSAPPMSAPPGSGGPGYPTGAFGAQPAPGQPGYGQPAYGQTGFQPTIDPATGMPIQGGPAPRKRGVAVPLLAGFLALAVIAAGVLVGLYVNTNSKLTASDKVVAQQKQSIADRDDELKKTKADLQAKSDALATAQQDLRGTQADSTETKRQKDIIAKCLVMLEAALTAPTAADFKAKVQALKDPCNAADSLLGL